MTHPVGASNQLKHGDISIHWNGNVNINQYSTVIGDPTSNMVATGLPLAASGPVASAAQIAPDAEEADADGKEVGNGHVVLTQRTGYGGLPGMPDSLVPAEQYNMDEGNSHMKKHVAYFWILD